MGTGKARRPQSTAIVVVSWRAAIAGPDGNRRCQSLSVLTTCGFPPPNRRKLSDAKEQARRTVAAALRVTPEEIVITRNTSEGNNFVSSGIDLKAGDDVLVSAENHPSLLNAWDEKAKRFGFSVRRVAHPSPHPGHPAIVEAFRAASPRSCWPNCAASTGCACGPHRTRHTRLPS